MTKIKYLIVLMIMILTQTGIFSISVIGLWEKKYFGAKDLKEKSEILANISKKATAEYEDLILKTLQDQADIVTPVEPQLFRNHEDCIFIIVDMMIKLKIKKGNEFLVKLYKKMSNPLHKGMIAEAIGMVGNKADLEFLNQELKLLNHKHKNAQYKDMDRLMYGLIRGLGYYNDKSSFYEVFYVAIPNFAKLIQDEAVIVLKNITSDPAPLYLEIIENDLDLRLVLEALIFANSSASPVEGKIKCSQAALKRSINQGNSGIREFFVIRDESAKFLGILKALDPYTIELLTIKWKYDNDTKSRLITIEALEKIASQEAGQALALWLRRFIDRKKADSSQKETIKEEDKILLAIVKALANTAGEAGIEELFDISPIFGNIIVEEARKSLEKKGIKL